jgi:hypothetical protein
MTAADRTQVVLGILNLLMGALCLLAFAFGESPALLIGLLCLPVAYLLLKETSTSGVDRRAVAGVGCCYKQPTP